ncbi:hypothetical protein QTI66_35780 [Variovorax sp. J22R133]|uniref:hypothetical protein n=1 Tax=Variovorax brevis TaxID=3053503 RepID=UPI002576D29C|nr:hypothetical protein [Variovorax sp. J22R133]MDM0117479.1 hypothetical protein [Variovorax sp. J22R133]
MIHLSHAGSAARFEVRFQSLFHEGRGYAFPCDAEGHVKLDSLSERGRSSYLHAQAMVGREFALPNVCLA